GRGPLRLETAHAIDDFVALLASLFAAHLALYLEDLCQPWPRAEPRQRCTRRECALCDTALPHIYGGGALLHVAPGWLRKHQGDVRAELRLILLDDHDIIPSLVHNRLRHVALREEGIHCDKTTFQDQLASKGLDGGNFIGFVIHSAVR